MRKRNCNKSHFSDRHHTKPGPDSKLILEEEFLIVMMRLKVGLFQKDLVHRFGISETTVSRLFTSWINLIYLELKDCVKCMTVSLQRRQSNLEDFPWLE